ncbi:DUF6362 family protein [Alphaproteobacteria bacterium LSUCC0684]
MTIKHSTEFSPDYHISYVREELIKAMAVLQLMPVTHRDLPAKNRSSWPAYAQGKGIVCGGTRKMIRRKVTPQEISHMEYWIEIADGLEEAPRRIVLARAGRIPWRRLEEIDGRSHTTLRKIERLGLERIAMVHLASQRHSLRKE